MRDTVTLRGVVIRTQPIGEYDKRLVILTRERGKITAFARGVRRAKSPLIAAVNPFVFAEFALYEGRDSYTLAGAEVKEYFSDLARMMPAVFYGYYVLEMAEYFGQEGLEAYDTVDLIYVTLKALMKGSLDPDLIRSIYEIRSFVINGVYAVPEQNEIGDDHIWKAFWWAAAAPFKKLYSFAFDPQIEKAMIAEAERVRERNVDRRFKTLDMIEGMCSE